MTTVAFDGSYLAADTLMTDSFGLRRFTTKVWCGENLAVGFSGDVGAFQVFIRDVLRHDITLDDLLKRGYAAYEKDRNDPQVLVVDIATRKSYLHVSGAFVRSVGPFCAIGSGRDFAYATMALGKGAPESVTVASLFDVWTGGDIEVFSIGQRGQPFIFDSAKYIKTLPYDLDYWVK